MQSKTLLITPPFTQLNTPYPGTAYLKGYLDEKGFDVSQVDLSIELFLEIFSSSFLLKAFSWVEAQDEVFYENILDVKQQYIDTVNDVVSFLQSPNTVDAYRILSPAYLPKFQRFSQLEDLDYSFGDMGILDKAKHFATLYIEELGDFIKANIDEDFGFTKYAEKIGRAASSFGPIEAKLNEPLSLIEEALITLVDEKVKDQDPNIIGLSVPFPGNLFSSLRIAQHIKLNYPGIKVLMGGGYCNTELRKLSDKGIFKYIDLIPLDDGEGPITKIIEYIEGKISEDELERTYLLVDDEVQFINKTPNVHIKHSELPCPSYEGLPLEKYVSFLDVLNPMHRMWSDGRWNKLTVSHGCYWAQCSFCDVGLDYIGRYENTSAEDLVNKMESMIQQTGDHGFHFVDEAAPPKMLKALSKEIIRRGLKVVWWTNIRFEKTFDFELCELMARSGCIAVTGGLEVASDRLLQKMKKGVSIKQVAKVTKAFSENGILVHAYLMYGFPTQTEQETIDSLEVVRQLFSAGCIQSGFWHRFSATSHSPVGLNPSEFNVEIVGPEFKGFAENDLYHEDSNGGNHDDFSQGLKTALYNYMNGAGLDWDVREWFDFELAPSEVPEDLVEGYLN